MSSPPISDVIARDILEGRCVLVLGPNAFMADTGDGDLRPIHEVVLNIVARKYGIEGGVASFEEILSKMPPENSGRFLILQSDIAQVLRELEDSVQLSPLSDKIASLPFKIIFNAGPDNLLTDVFARLAIPFYNAFYDFDAAGQRPNDEFEFGEQFPTLIYNLYGSVMKPESLVFTSRNQDRYEKAIIRHGLPRSIKRELLRNDTFVFLGFDGKDWTTRQTNETLFSENSESNRQRKIAVGPEASTSYSFGGDFYVAGIIEFVDEVFGRCLQLDPDFESKRAYHTRIPTTQFVSRRRYPGLKPFEEAERNLFFGQEHAVELLSTTVLREPITVLSGLGGVGKSSLLRAGCAPRWLQEGFAPIFLRSFPSSVQTLTESIWRQLVQSPYVELGNEAFYSTRPGLLERMSQIRFVINGVRAIPVLIFDQFETFFEYPEEDQRVFFKELSDLIRQPQTFLAEQIHTDYRIVISIRSGYLSRLETLSRQIPSILQNRIELPPDTRVEVVRKAITQPASLEGDFESPPFTYSLDAVEQILESLRFPDNSVSAEQVGSLFQIQLICQHIESKIIEQGVEPGFVVTPKFYGGDEGLEEVLDNPYLTGIAMLLTAEQEKASLLLEEELLSNDNRRLSIAEDVLLNRPGVSRGLLQEMVASHLLQIEQRSGQVYYEISNEVWLPTLIKSRNERQRIEAQSRYEIEVRERQKQIAEATLLFRFSAPGPKYLLAIEGGDSEVLGQLALLAAFEEKMRNKTGNSRYRISDTFDLIGGAGLGNVVAVQLSLGESIGHLLEDYELEKGSHALLTAGQTLAIKYAEESIAPNWKTGFCYLKSAAYSWSPPLTNHPAKALSLSDTLVEFGSEERDNAAEGISKEWLYGSTKSTLLQISTRSDYPFGWPIGEENLCILSIERSTIVVPPDLRPEKGAIWQGLPTPPTEYRIKQLADWIFESNQKKSPLGFQPCNLKQLSLPLKEAPDKLDFKDWGWLYALAMRELESFDLTPFLPKTTV